MRTAERPRRRLGAAMAVPALVKTVCGAVLATLAVVVWQQLADLEERRELSEDWEDVQDYAVFYPHAIGNDQEELEIGGHTTKIAEARDLYPALEADGAIFVDAVNYETGVPDDPSSPWPVPPIRVNTNYLAQYPILDESGAPIELGDDERAWVVAVPEQYKPREAELLELFQSVRTGGQGFQSVMEAQERIFGEPVPEELAEQEVRIVWTASGQEVFSFNSNVNPEGGHTITDPIVEIMTPSNTLMLDRINAITGDMNTPLKVRVDGDPAATLAELAPLLRDLGLDDNLRHLVTAHEAMLTEAGDVETAIAWVTAVAVAALLVMLALNAALVVIASDRLRRKLTVRRLHGIGFARTYRELLTILGVTWLVQALFAGVAVVVLELNSGGEFEAAVEPFAQMPRLLAVLAVSLGIEALFVAVTAGVVERRDAVKRLKEL